MRAASATQSALHRWLAPILTAALLVALAMPALASAEESEFIGLINQRRSAAGLGPLSEFWDLTDDARVHTAAMISAGQIYHSTNAELSSYTTGWARLGENVGMGPNPSLLHQAFMNSPGHRANILGDYDRVGVGTARSGDGTLFVTVLFMKSSQPAPTTTTTAPPPTTTTAPPSTTTTTTAVPVTSPTTTTTTLPAPAPTTPSTTTTTVPAPPPGSPDAVTPQPDALLTRTSVPADGTRPATRVSNVSTDRSVDAFRPVFRYLDIDLTVGPITVITSNGVELTIE